MKILDTRYFTEQDFVELGHLLPPSFREFVDLVGEEAAFQLTRRYAGTAFPVGRGHKKQSQALHFALVEIVGEKMAKKIELSYGVNRKVYIPKCDGVVREMRNRLIRRQFDDWTMNDGLTANLAVRNLVYEHHLCERTIWYILEGSDSVPTSATKNFSNNLTLSFI